MCWSIRRQIDLQQGACSAAVYWGIPSFSLRGSRLVYTGAAAVDNWALAVRAMVHGMHPTLAGMYIRPIWIVLASKLGHLLK